MFIQGIKPYSELNSAKSNPNFCSKYVLMDGVWKDFSRIKTIDESDLIAKNPVFLNLKGTVRDFTDKFSISYFSYIDKKIALTGSDIDEYNRLNGLVADIDANCEPLLKKLPNFQDNITKFSAELKASVGEKFTDFFNGALFAHYRIKNFKDIRISPIAAKLEDKAIGVADKAA